MKKIVVFGMLAAAGLLLATSCQNDELTPAVQAGEEVDVTFNLIQSGISTRAVYSDGQTATTLTYAVYDADVETITPLIVSEDEVTFSDLTATVSLRLVTGKSYDIIFWADAPVDESATNPYTFNSADQTISVSYDSVTSQDETRDAFYAHVSLEKVSGAVNETVELKRPFAQLNIGTTDYDESSKMGFTPANTAVKVSNVYSTLNLLTDKVEGDAESVTFASAAIPENETFPVAEVTYLAMDYLLVDSAKALVDVEFTVDNKENENGEAEKEIVSDYTNVPVQRNYRTNIYGALLTNPADFTITIIPEYETPANPIEIWDGTTTTQPELSEDGTTYIVSTAAEWVWLKTNGTSGKNIKLDASLDFGGFEVKGLGFKGEFDGQGYAMSNMTLVAGGSNYSVGLFQGDASGEVTVKNVTIENVNIDIYNKDQGYAGVIFGDTQNTTPVTLSSVNVKNANVRGVQSVAGLVGFVASTSTLTIENCSVDGSTLTNYAVADESGFVAGLVGRPVGTVNITNSTVTNTTIDAYYATKRSEDSINAIIPTVTSESGASSSSYTGTITTDAATTATNVTVTKKYIASSASELSTALTDATTAVVSLSEDLDLGDASTNITTLSISSDKEIDLNGNTLTVSEIDVADGASLEIEDGSLTTSLRVGGESTVSLDNVDMTSTSTNCGIEIGNEITTKATIVGNTKLTVTNSTIDVTGYSGSATGIIVQGAGNEVVIENTTIKHTFIGITQNGTTPGSTFILNDVTISGPKHGVYLSNNASGTANSLTVNGGSIYSSDATPIEVKKTTLSVENVTLTSGATWQGYFFYGAGACSLGYGIVLAGHADGVAYDAETCPYYLSNITYERPNVVAVSGQQEDSDLFNAGIYNGYLSTDSNSAYNSLDAITADGAVTE